MKKVFPFLLAMVLIFVAFPATAGPPAALASVESVGLVLDASPIEASIVAPLYEPVLSFKGILASPLIAAISSKTELYTNAVMAMLAALTGLGFAVTASRLKYDIRDRMHGLPRDQDFSLS